MPAAMDLLSNLQDGLPPPAVLAGASAVVLAASLLLLLFRTGLLFGSSAASAAPASSSPAPRKVPAKPDSEALSAKHHVLVLYGTQTGTAERFAKKIASDGSARYGDVARFKAVDVEDLDFKQELPKVS